MKWEQLLCAERKRTTTIGPDHRVQFERDFDRAIFSTPVKRLQDKAQVFPLEPCDAIRTRLTHSLEVSSVARGIAISVGKQLEEKRLIQPSMSRQIEAIAATCGLIHDLGNPPFGHAGEDAIRYWFEKRFGEKGLTDLLKETQLVQDFRAFEGNAQTLRLVGKLQLLADFNGLNLTFGTLSAACKYTAASNEANSEHADHAKAKPGYFASEASLVALIREKTGTGDARNPITFLVEAADDIVYSVADIEDGIKKGILTWTQFEQVLRKTACKNQTDEARANECLGAVLARKEAILKAGREAPPENLPDDVHGSAFRTAAIGLMVEAVEKAFESKYEEIMAGNYHGELVKESSYRGFIEKLKTIGKLRIYCTAPTLKLELMGRAIITDLMDLFWEGANALPLDGKVKTNNFPGRIGALLSNNYRSVFLHSVEELKHLPEAYHRLQLVTDYVCGMTDSFAKRLHGELKNGYSLAN